MRWGVPVMKGPGTNSSVIVLNNPTDTATADVPHNYLVQRQPVQFKMKLKELALCEVFKHQFYMRRPMPVHLTRSEGSICQIKEILYFL